MKFQEKYYNSSDNLFFSNWKHTTKFVVFMYIRRVYKCKNSKQCSVFPLRWRSASEILDDSRERMLMKRYCHSCMHEMWNLYWDGWLERDVSFFFLYCHSFRRNFLEMVSPFFSCNVETDKLLNEEPDLGSGANLGIYDLPSGLSSSKRRKRFQFYCSLTSLTRGR